MQKIRALIVDDSAFMRKSIEIMLKSDDQIEVIASARDGEEGYELAKKMRPDVITMDIEMPRMDGLTSLKKIMHDCPTSVIMISSLTSEGAEATLQAMELGAVDFIPKELSYINVNIINIRDDLIRKIKAIVKQRSLSERLARIQQLSLRSTKTQAGNIRTSTQLPKIGYKAVALGISTGGPMSLQKIIPRFLKKNMIPYFIVQHMPPKFTKLLAQRLDTLSEVEVKEAEHNETVRNGVVYIAPGGFHMTVKKNGTGTVSIDITEEPTTTLHRPSVDIMIDSVVKIYGKHTMGIIMTGMGKDGLEGIRSLKKLGGHCLAQDEESCIVYGMPKSIVNAGFADVIASLEDITKIINEAL
ncbi:MAG: chemotaxis response regulator protein-glutamate methylesterase [Ignavibacteriaceae bacterium]|nr:chemotaxis response regulator protein-glutamate methylesterase [Ignavibacteriaceae bacterium]